MYQLLHSRLNMRTFKLNSKHVVYTRCLWVYAYMVVLHHAPTLPNCALSAQYYIADVCTTFLLLPYVLRTMPLYKKDNALESNVYFLHGRKHPVYQLV